jgi:hypothetical protein
MSEAAEMEAVYDVKLDGELLTWTTFRAALVAQLGERRAHSALTPSRMSAAKSYWVPMFDVARAIPNEVMPMVRFSGWLASHGMLTDRFEFVTYEAPKPVWPRSVRAR